MKGNCKRYVDRMNHNYNYSASIFLNKNNQGRSYQSDCQFASGVCRLWRSQLLNLPVNFATNLFGKVVITFLVTFKIIYINKTTRLPEQFRSSLESFQHDHSAIDERSSLTVHQPSS